MELTPTFENLAKEAARMLTSEILRVKIEGMSGYFVTCAKTPLPKGAEEFARSRENGESFIIYYL